MKRTYPIPRKEFPQTDPERYAEEIPMAKPRTALCTHDLLRMAKSPVFQGWGFLGHSCRRPEFWVESSDPYAVAKLVDRTVVEVANQLGWDPPRLFAWCNGKEGRYFGDDLEANDSPTVVRSKAVKSMGRFKG